MENLRGRATKAAIKQLSWQNWERPGLEATYGTLEPSKASDSAAG